MAPQWHPPCLEQVWEETAARHVSIKAELGALGALATRWRRLELGSWKGALKAVAVKVCGFTL